MPALMQAVSPYCDNLPLEGVSIYDSTLREGEQMPGVAFSVDQKVEIARRLADFGLTEIEAGFPAVSSQEVRAIRAVQELELDVDISVLARCRESDVELALSLEPDLVILFLPTSDTHLTFRLQMTRDEVFRQAQMAIDTVNSHGIPFALSTEDSTRAEFTFLRKVLIEARDRGARRIGISDTVGCADPAAMTKLVSRLLIDLPDIPLHVQTHDDHGLALANALAAFRAGAKLACTTVNGIGERAGNCDLFQLAYNLKKFHGVDLGFDWTKGPGLADLVARYAGVPISATAPLMGRNIFRHESGLHVSGLRRDPTTYESIHPEEFAREREFVLGKHSNIAALDHRLELLGIELDVGTCEKVLKEIKRIGALQGSVDDRELRRIISETR